MILFLKMCSLAIRRHLLCPGDDNARALTIVLVSRDEGQLGDWTSPVMHNPLLEMITTSLIFLKKTND